MVRTYICPLINTPTPEGVIISQPIFRFLGVIFDLDHDFEGPRAPKAHLDTVLRNLSSHLGIPRMVFCVPCVCSYVRLYLAHQHVCLECVWSSRLSRGCKNVKWLAGSTGKFTNPVSRGPRSPYPPFFSRLDPGSHRSAVCPRAEWRGRSHPGISAAFARSPERAAINK